jgi:tetratricopeptide (TPR) repeat protein
VRELPAGTVTFLFTDVEGSTRLLREHRERYAQLLSAHRRVLRGAFARHGGVEVDTQGDAFFVSFARASDAVLAAEEAQQALRGGAVRVRMGIHTGEPQVTDDGYVGMDVHRAARICAAANGGQVLVSQATRDLVGTALRDLGTHRLKDVGSMRLFQLGRAEFPPPRTLNQANLPSRPTPLVGRDGDLATVLELLTRDRVGLVTVTGAGGIGKTRFALEVAAEATDAFPDGVWLVDLSAVRESALVLPAIASALTTDGDAIEHIRDRQMLLVLDNFEQVVEAAPDIMRLLDRCTGLALLITSREPLRVGAEREHRLEPLAETRAVDLFRLRAQAIDPDFDAPDDDVAAVCRRLDNLPLAVELAAACTRLFTPAELRARLDRALPLLTAGRRDVPERQQTLRATFEWSYDLLPTDEQALFRRLAVFGGGCTFDEAERVCGASADGVASLLDKAMLWRQGDRYSMLQVVREFALDQLPQDERDHVAAALVSHLLSFERRRADPRDDIDNWRVAVDWALARADADTAMRSAALGPMWRPNPAEVLHWAHRALDERAGAASPRNVIELLAVTTLMHQFRAEHGEAADVAKRAVALARPLGDAALIAHVLSMLGQVMKSLDLDRADTVLREAVGTAERSGSADQLLPALSGLGELERDRGRLSAARPLLERAVAVADEHGLPGSASRHGLGDLCLEEGDTQGARRWYLAALDSARRNDAFYVTLHCMGGLAATAAAEGREAEALELWAAAEAFGRARGAHFGREERARYERALGAADRGAREAAEARWHDMPDEDVVDEAPALAARA